MFCVKVAIIASWGLVGDNGRMSEQEPQSDKELFAQAKKAIPGGVNSPVRAYGSVGGTPHFIKEAFGAYVRDEEDHTFVDLVGSWGPALLGHACPPVVRAVQETAAKGLSFGAPTVTPITALITYPVASSSANRRCRWIDDLRLLSEEPHKSSSLTVSALYAH